jgi:hypothetical protein
MTVIAAYRPHLNISLEDLERNIRNSLRYPQFRPGGGEGAVAICAAGPSLLDHLELLKALKLAGVPICAVKGVEQVLIDNGIVPDFAVNMDGRPDQIRFYDKPHKDVEYLIAGQCDPAVFKALEGYKVTVWHGEGRSLGILPEDTAYILGGSTTGLRAISLMWSRGYTVPHLFGFDCCVRENSTHVYEVTNPKLVRDYYMGLKHFRATTQMVHQYNEFLGCFGEDRKLTMFIYGNGLIAEAWRRLNDTSNSPVVLTFAPIGPIDLSGDPAEVCAAITFETAKETQACL